MRILVTGGAGYLGVHVVNALHQAGHEVVIFDALLYGDEPLRALPQDRRCVVVKGDVRRLQEHAGLLDGINTVVHLAGMTDEPSCAMESERAWDVNVESTRELASHAMQAGVRRFLLASCVETDNAAESVLFRSKRAAEDILTPMRGKQMDVIFVRLPFLYGLSGRMRFDLPVNAHAAHAAGRLSKTELPAFNGEPLQPVAKAAHGIAKFAEFGAMGVRIVDSSEAVPRLSLDEMTARVETGVNGKPASDQHIECAAAQIRDWLNDLGHDPDNEQFWNARTLRRALKTPIEEGGEPVAPRFIPLARPVLGPEEEESVLDALRSGWLTSGPHIGAFEKSFCETTRAKHAVAVVSCTAALHLCLVDAGVGPGDEVITSPITWASTGNTILNMGAKVVFADVEPDTLNIDPAAVERAITERTKVIMPVHMAGQPCDLEAIRAIGARHGIPIVEDAAHALGAACQGTPIGAEGDYACFSFYAIKNITTMEGGAITVADPERAKHLRLLAANGMTATAWERYGRSAAPSPPEVVAPGFKYLMGNVNAAMGLEQLKKWPEFHQKRRTLASRYQDRLGEIDEIQTLRVRNEVTHAWHLMIVRLRLGMLTKNRDEIVQALRRENVGTGVHFLALHVHRYYRETLGIRPEDFPEASAAAHDVLSLPLYPGMELHHVDYVVDALKKVLRHARKPASAIAP